MKELKIFIIIAFLAGVMYWGIEPYAHSVMHPHVNDVSYDFAMEDINQAKFVLEAKKVALEKTKKLGDDKKTASAQKEVEEAQSILDEYTNFWNEIKSIDFAKGDAIRGKEAFENAGCIGCHGVDAIQNPAPMDAETASEAYGVNPPDLSTAGLIYDEKFLAAVIKNPTMALKLSHKFNDEKPYPMPQFSGLGGDMNQELSDIVAYLKSIAPKQISDQKVFHDACQRCHDMKYEKDYVTSNRVNLANYLGSNPPDLSMMIRSKGDEYLHKFINDTQKMLPGTTMPRVGLTMQAENQVVEYMTKAGDDKKTQRENLGVNIMIYFFIFGLFAYLWKRKIWSELH